MLCGSLGAQTFKRNPAPRPDAIPQGWVDIQYLTQTKEGPWYHLKGAARIETSQFLLKADEIDYNEDTGDAEARGNVYLKRYASGEELWADHADYNTEAESGKFFKVRGSAPVELAVRPGILPSTNPFYFEGEWAERSEDRYVLHNGFITNCKMPKPWWVLRGPLFDVIPGQRALAYRTTLRLRGVPLFYSPVFYKSLEKLPRRSGFLMPNLGNSSRRGKMVGVGYYWAINRSYDATYQAQYFTQRGIAHNVDFRGKPTEGSDFNAVLFGVNDRGLKLNDGQRLKQGGFQATVDARADLGRGFNARGEINYLSSMTFRQAFSESFNEAVFSEVHSTGFVNKFWNGYGLNFVFQRAENFQSTQPDDTIVIRKLPEVQFESQDRQIWSKGIPVWVSLESSAGLLRRKQPLFQTRQFLERLDFEPRIMTALRWKGFSLLPSFSLRESHWGEQEKNGRIIGQNINRSSREFSVVLEPPSLARTFDAPKWMGDKVKHVIEPSATFKYVTGVDDFDRLIRFDDTELLSNTTQAEISIVNRLYTKKNGVVNEFLSWEISQQRYFDPTFGGALTAACAQPGTLACRNVVLSAIELTPYAFLDGPRNYSPLVSAFRVSPLPGFGLNWRADYDPLRGKMVNSGLTADVRHGNYFLSLGNTSVRSVPQLSPPASQLRALVGFGNENKRGWNAAFSAIYDYRVGQMQFATTQVSYNTDCCGWSVQYRRIGWGTLHDNQFRVSFALANIGSFGTLKKQERIF